VTDSEAVLLKNAIEAQRKVMDAERGLRTELEQESEEEAERGKQQR
jgi:hypothetical protein